MKFVRVATRTGTAWYDVNIEDLLTCEFRQSSGGCWHILTFKNGSTIELALSPPEMQPLYKAMGLAEDVA